MSNLNDAFLKAYAKRPAENSPSSGSRERASLPLEAPNYFASVAHESARSTSAHGAPAVQERHAQESTATAVVSSLRTASKSATVRKVDAPHTATSRFDGASDRHYRVDEIVPAPVNPTVLAATQPPAAKQVKRQPLSEYLAEMRQQVSEIEQRATNAPDHAPFQTPKERHFVQEVQVNRDVSSAVYTYPEKKPVTSNNPVKPTAGASATFLDKRTLRQLATSSGPAVSNVSEEPQRRTEQAPPARKTQQQAPAQVAGSNAAKSAVSQPKMEPLTVRQTWREAERIHRVDSEGRPIGAPHVDPARHAPPPAGTNPQIKEFANRRIDEAPVKAREDQPAPHWDNAISSASVAMAQSLAGYNPNSESSVLYRQAKVAGPTNKTQLEQKLARSNQAIVAPLNPEWEVDTFQWPFTVLDLLEAQEPAFEEIANHLMAANRKGLKTVAITSAERGVGKSTTCMCLGALMAHKGLKVAIVDGDVENPALFNQLNLEFPHGWQDCIRDNVPLESVAVKSLSETVTLFPLTDSMSGEEVSNSRIKVNHLLRRIAKSYDMVFVDTHKISYRSNQLIGTGDDAALDAALVVVDTELSVKERIDTTLQMLHDQKINSIGVVENFSNLDFSSDQDS